MVFQITKGKTAGIDPGGDPWARLEPDSRTSV